MAALRSACQVEKVELKDQKIVVYGFGELRRARNDSPLSLTLAFFPGSAGLGIADGIRNAMVHDGVAEDDAAKAFWFVLSCDPCPPPDPHILSGPSTSMVSSRRKRKSFASVKTSTLALSRSSRGGRRTRRRDTSFWRSSNRSSLQF
jgi:hypothetical protein